jgi:peptidoglycan/xylan/chitin deacetylase (PgdA/CDA1 family)
MLRIVALRLLPAAGVIAAVLVLVLVLVAAGGRGEGDDGASAASPLTARASREPVPILVYHAIRTAPARARLPSLFVAPRELAGQVRALRRAGYSAVTLQRVWDAWHGRARLPRRPLVLSFDDGYESQVRVALPLLRRERWPGVLNLALDWVDDLGGDGAVRRLVDAGWQIDAHSRTHADLTRVAAAQLADETAGARAELQARFDVPANFFAYPSGRYDARVAAAVRAAGYLAATTVKRSLARPADRYALARVQVSAGTSPERLLRRLRELRRRAAASAR